LGFERLDRIRREVGGGSSGDGWDINIEVGGRGGNDVLWLGGDGRGRSRGYEHAPYMKVNPKSTLSTISAPAFRSSKPSTFLPWLLGEIV
jgi:hypothetical protein